MQVEGELTRPQVPYPAHPLAMASHAPAVYVSRSASSVSDLDPTGAEYNRPKQRGSRASDTSSICSGSDSVPQSSVDDQEQDSDDEEGYDVHPGVSEGR